MIYVLNGEKRYKCTAPEEHRINIHPQQRQWVIDFIICDAIIASELDVLLELEELTFVCVDDTTGAETSLVFSGYTKINSAAIKYEQDLSCTSTVQLGKEIENNAVKI